MNGEIVPERPLYSDTIYFRTNGRSAGSQFRQSGGIFVPLRVPSTSPVTGGTIIGGDSDAVDLQYAGNGRYKVQSYSGYLTLQ